MDRKNRRRAGYPQKIQHQYPGDQGERKDQYGSFTGNRSYGQDHSFGSRRLQRTAQVFSHLTEVNEGKRILRAFRSPAAAETAESEILCEIRRFRETHDVRLVLNIQFPDSITPFEIPKISFSSSKRLSIFKSVLYGISENSLSFKSDTSKTAP